MMLAFQVIEMDVSIVECGLNDLSLRLHNAGIWAHQVGEVTESSDAYDSARSNGQSLHGESVIG